jgi:hypothetical protein
LLLTFLCISALFQACYDSGLCTPSLMRLYATSRNVVGSIHDEVIGFVQFT